MSEKQWTMTMALCRCSMLPGSFQKRFCRDLANNYQSHDRSLSEKQALYLEKLYYSYRKQISASGFYDATTYPPFVNPAALPANQPEDGEGGGM